MECIDKLGGKTERQRYTVELDNLLQWCGNEKDKEKERNNIKKYAEKFVQQHTDKMKGTNKNGWFNKKCNKIQEEKVKARLKWVKANTTNAGDEYKRLRKELTKLQEAE